ncbi:hypothetical protein AGOR_G00002670 [Albula goreensis]|uniref:C2H2-type domain-containing protein n=1 Tax=Albula goreensis TaxID=1534307 RepID=A0A8T3EAC3_9TELE|nr:hypothetical protein AGOR_G00002670 [Albula goreensis]
MSEQAICCTLVNCSCESFKPGKLRRRQCEHCRHGWVAHALSKLKVQHLFHGGQVEIVHSSVVFDICSLMLYGTQAIPVRLKILLDRLFSVLKQEEVVQILNALDWTLQDYIRGYVLQDVTGRVLDRWAIMTLEEEMAAMQQFLRFGETKSIVELMAVQDKESQAVLVPSSRTSSGIRAFIESSTHHGSEPPPGPPPSNSVHHFENLISSMAFLLPFQYLGSLPTPLLGSTPGAFVSNDHTPAPPPAPAITTETSLVGSTSAFECDAEKCNNRLGTATPKIETDDFPASDTYSDAPSTPSMTSDPMQMSPEGKLHPSEKGGAPGSGGGAGLKKGRVFCSACEKTFYDKGTLKIHYNAVHLKIKHRCTVQGCNMVFSSLRSRNRHSANPNPRLHMPMNRNGRDRDPRGASSNEGAEGEEELGESRPVSSYVVSSSDSRLQGQSTFPSAGHGGMLFPNLKTVQPVLPFYRSLVTPITELANAPGATSSLPLISSSSTPPINTSITMAPADPVPKKKSRKSSMPVKIETETVQPAMENGLDLALPPQPLPLRGAREQPDSSVGSVCEKRAACYRDDSELSSGKKAGERCVLEGGVASSTSPQDPDVNMHHNSPIPPPLENGKELHNIDMVEHDPKNSSRGRSRVLAFGGNTEPSNCNGSSSPKIVEPRSAGSSEDTEHCETSWNDPSTIVQQCRAHEQEMHDSDADGCAVVSPCSRSRDRNSTNPTPVPMELAGDPCRDTSTGPPQAAPLTEPLAQPSVIFKGYYRTGLVFPLSKATESSLAAPVEGDEEEEEEEEAVLDLSATSVSQSGRGIQSSWDSDGGGAGEESSDSHDGTDPAPGQGLCPNLDIQSEDCPSPQRHGDSPITCPACHKTYSNKGTFRAHYKTVHLRLLHKCKVPGCATSFSSVRSRNRHSQNPNLHRNLTATMTTAVPVTGSPLAQPEQPTQNGQGLLA